MWTIGPILILTLISFRFIMPYRIPEKFKGISMRELDAEFKNLHIISLLIFFGCAILLIFLFDKSFGLINDFRRHDASLVFEIVGLDKDLWTLISIFLGMGFSVILLNLNLKLILKENREKFWFYYSLKNKFNALPVLNLLTGLLIFSGLTLIYLGTDTYIKFSDTNIQVNPMFSLNEKTYDYSEINEIALIPNIIAPNGDVVYRPHYKITFNDKYEWSTLSNMREPKSEDRIIFDYLSKKTGLAIRNEATVLQ